MTEFQRNSCCYLGVGDLPFRDMLSLGAWRMGPLPGYVVAGCVEDGAWRLWGNSSVAAAVARRRTVSQTLSQSDSRTDGRSVGLSRGGSSCSNIVRTQSWSVIQSYMIILQNCKNSVMVNNAVMENNPSNL